MNIYSQIPYCSGKEAVMVDTSLCRYWW